jgi:hypothetical protein
MFGNIIKKFTGKKNNEPQKNKNGNLKKDNKPSPNKKENKKDNPQIQKKQGDNVPEANDEDISNQNFELIGRVEILEAKLSSLGDSMPNDIKNNLIVAEEMKNKLHVLNPVPLPYQDIQLIASYTNHFDSGDFYSKLKNKSNIVILMRNNFGREFGCYLSKTISNSNINHYTKDKNAYIFSRSELDNKFQKFKIKSEYAHQAIFVDENILFGLGNVDLLISDKCFEKLKSCYCNISESYYAEPGDYVKLTQEKEFHLIRLEIYELM